MNYVTVTRDSRSSHPKFDFLRFQFPVAEVGTVVRACDGFMTYRFQFQANLSYLASLYLKRTKAKTYGQPK